MKKILLSLFCFFTLSLSAQQLEHAQGQILIQLENGGNLKNVIRDFQTFEGQKTEISIKKEIVRSLRMYSLEFDFATINENELLNSIARHADVLAAQFNRLINTRLIPNDPQFADQWQYINTGQSGGTTGADIDMDLAWDITTGGVTANGDTIVVAALDDGIDLNHADFEDNRWRNYAEIPNNGIDDDGNGYIDDYEGWNSTNDTDNIAGGGHGTPVAGIMGAKGNNEVGVSGISWDVKVMIIKNDFQTSEAGVLAAYGYALTQRQRYNESNGTEGAFVVATNASWGIDQGQPDDSPLWCGFYDTLGEQGILNCGATANANFNIDEVGDLPTACPSDFMISVTNMNDDDVKVTGAGYGLETIDLGAFGQDTWTTAQGGGYAGFGGTSGATPHVTGTIGLLYSAPCSNLASLAMSDPMAAALAVRSYVLDGVDPNESLDGITVTGGRLNVRNSLDLLIEDCGPCPAPSALTADIISDTEVNLTWVNNDSTLTTDLRWRAVGTADWIETLEVVSPFSLADLLACTAYEFQVLGHCASEDSEYSASNVFTTDGCCDAPEDVVISDVTENSLTVTWESVLAAESYLVQYRIANSETWLELPATTDLTVGLVDLTPCSVYEIQLATVCATETTPYGVSSNIIIGGCGACTDNEYCEQPQGSVVDEWIESITIQGEVWASGANDGAATFFGNPPVFDVSQEVSMTMAMGYAGQEYPEFFTIWVDLDQNGDFEGADEMLFASTTASIVPVDAMFNIPSTAANGVTRMRVRMLYNASPTFPCSDGNFFYGETEDYCVEITNAGFEPCSEVTSLTETSSTTSSISAEWDAVENVENYNVKYVLSAGGTETDVATTNTSIDIDGLTSCTEYDISVQTVCLDGGLSEWVTQTIATMCIPCPEVTNLDSSATTINSITMAWDAAENVENYNVKYVPTTGGATIETTTTELSMIIEELAFCTEYEISVQTACTDGGTSEWVDKIISTSCLSSNENLLKEADEIQLFPNPFTNKLNLQISLNQNIEELKVEVLNVRGQILYREQMEGLTIGQNTFPILLENSTEGVYFVRILNGDQSVVKKVISVK